MASHAAIRDSVLEVSRRIAQCNPDVDAMQRLLRHVEESQPGPAFSASVRTYLSPNSEHIASKDIEAIALRYPDFPVKTCYASLSAEDAASAWQALAMTNMLMTTLQMLPPEMMNKVEEMTSSMMSALQGSNGFSGLEQLIRSGFGGSGGGSGGANRMTGESRDDDEDLTVPRPKAAKTAKGTQLTSAGASKQAIFREKLC